MDSETKAQLKATLDGYLETSRHRKTSERYAILDAVCEMTGHFTIEDLGERLLSRNFPVSRATLYNTISLFIKLHIVVRHRLPAGTRYEICDMENKEVKYSRISSQSKYSPLTLLVCCSYSESSHTKRLYSTPSALYTASSAL